METSRRRRVLAALQEIGAYRGQVREAESFGVSATTIANDLKVLDYRRRNGLKGAIVMLTYKPFTYLTSRKT